MIKPVLSPTARSPSRRRPSPASTRGGKDAGGNAHATEDMLVVTDYPENLDAVRKILKEIDRRPQQILIEATILRATLNEDNALGVDFNVLGGVDFATSPPAPAQITGADGAITAPASGTPTAGDQRPRSRSSATASAPAPATASRSTVPAAA